MGGKALFNLFLKRILLKCHSEHFPGHLRRQVEGDCAHVSSWCCFLMPVVAIFALEGKVFAIKEYKVLMGDEYSANIFKLKGKNFFSVECTEKLKVD